MAKRTLDPAGLCRDPETPQPIRAGRELLTDFARMNSDVEARDVLSTALRGHLASLEQLDVVKVDVQCWCPEDEAEARCRREDFLHAVSTAGGRLIADDFRP